MIAVSAIDMPPVLIHVSKAGQYLVNASVSAFALERLRRIKLIPVFQKHARQACRAPAGASSTATPGPLASARLVEYPYHLHGNRFAGDIEKPSLSPKGGTTYGSLRQVLKLGTHTTVAVLREKMVNLFRRDKTFVERP